MSQNITVIAVAHPLWGRWGLAVLAYCAVNAAESKDLGRVGSRIAVMPKEEIMMSASSSWA